MRDLRREPDIGGLKLSFFLICLVYNFTEAAFKILSPVWITFLWATMATPLAAKTAVVVRPRAKSIPFFAARGIIIEPDRPSDATSTV